MESAGFSTLIVGPVVQKFAKKYFIKNSLLLVACLIRKQVSHSPT